MQKIIFLLLLTVGISTAFSQTDKPSCNDSAKRNFTLPSLRFRVIDDKGISLSNLRPTGYLTVRENIWTGTGILLIDVLKDPYWAQNNYVISLDVSFDAQKNAYISAPVPNLWLARKDGKCVREEILFVTFLDQDNNRAEYRILLPKSKKELPSGEKEIKLLMPDDADGTDERRLEVTDRKEFLSAFICLIGAICVLFFR